MGFSGPWQPTDYQNQPVTITDELPMTPGELDAWRILHTKTARTPEQEAALRQLHQKYLRHQGAEDAARRQKFPPGTPVGPQHQPGNSPLDQARRKYAERYAEHIKNGHPPEVAHRNAEGDLRDSNMTQMPINMSLGELQDQAWQLYLHSGGRDTTENARRLAEDVATMRKTMGASEVVTRLSQRFSLLSGS
jgi:hypothetical protein